MSLSPLGKIALGIRPGVQAQAQARVRPLAELAPGSVVVRITAEERDALPGLCLFACSLLENPPKTPDEANTRALAYLLDVPLEELAGRRPVLELVPKAPKRSQRLQSMPAPVKAEGST